MIGHTGQLGGDGGSGVRIVRYEGAQAATDGTLAIGASGTIANTPSVTLSNGTTFDVSAASGFTLGATQTLAGLACGGFSMWRRRKRA